ncbi:MAG: polysaccharide pyruvyl transferase YvfF [Aequorivita sp.]|nr:polysaccharide pyruvyl transferase YvfF [Aequorivita sp.]|tara:strand:- start:61994 stop:62980 length:987 start_codon:yes stop_codon:yes gene_type:complete
MGFKTLTDLKTEIHKQLAHKIQSDCVLLNTPDHINIGDQLIWQGELEFLNSLNIVPSYMTSHFNFDWRDLNKETQILLHGGGNFGDVWEGHNDFRLKIVERYPNNAILVFPQSVQYNDERLIIRDAKKYATHKNVTICARDKYSYDLLRKHFKNNILLVPDMAFCLDIEKPSQRVNNRKLLLKRVDREISTGFKYNNYSDFEHKDWPTFNNSFFNFSHRVWEKINRMFAKTFLSSRTKDTTFGLGVLRDRNWLVNEGISFILSYDLVVSTRLHGHILALLLGVPSIMIDNSYGKNRRFYETWLKDIPDSQLVTNPNELEAELSKFVKI